MSSTTILQTGQTLVSSPTYIDHGISVKNNNAVDSEASSEMEADQHPLRVKPSGNALTSPHNAQASMGCFGLLPDTLLLILLECLNRHSLANLGATCRGLYAYCTYDQLWRDIAVNEMKERFEWRGSWRASLMRLPSPKLAKVDCRYVFSDALYRPFQCSRTPLTPYISNIPPQNEIPRLDNISPEEFNEAWVGRPFILTAPVKKWKAFGTWDLQYLLSKYGNVSFRCEAVDWPLRTYVKYMENSTEESPLYLFDRAFVEKMGVQDAYDPPKPFQEDFFTLLKDQRPDRRWLIIGPERSGSTFHKDPNATSAWNAIIRGSKYWIMFPSSILPPGVYMSQDQSEVTSPLSIAEWLLSYHAEARRTSGCLEGICREGEVLHVPSGWWHLVVNLEPAIAITQNFVPRAHVRSAVRFLRDRADQVSGFSDKVTDPYNLFMDRLKETDPDLAATLDDARKRKWEEVVAGQDEADEERQGFSFGFSDELDEEVE
ncbi:uncharacterized protein Z520_10741 [Fonsecaea multimorphosa CBS 102226]|uniref:JmjC domain-containing protein n=1 Tax=Fonsecaea multimorphosa CBS 102226 TaxID=1442371 RepID=A0A0D2KAP9_9EURO|nr:uncharacterized protein Z520_10741 [Fonsecaea multimorphosa CBS 102226]KIX93563.1 hypothetical protein Z520_10741 [Fonsecaea multimorphosa CBS 102226]OAL18875.1 hypothetical protein AYO22_10204 [Fonsecaea multimorphosa]